MLTAVIQTVDTVSERERKMDIFKVAFHPNGVKLLAECLAILHKKMQMNESDLHQLVEMFSQVP